MRSPLQRPFARPLISFAVIPGVVLLATILARQAVSPALALGIGFVLAVIAGLMGVVLDSLARREVRVASSVGRVRDFRQSVSIYDKDSGLYSDWYLGLRLREEIARSHRYGQPFTLLLIEASEGYLGETVRKLVFQALTDSLRDTDIVAHLTDKRFAVLLTNTDGNGALVAAERVRESMPLRTVSVGIASYPGDGRDAASLLAVAGASIELVSAITRGAQGTRTSIAQSDWTPRNREDAQAEDSNQGASVEPPAQSDEEQADLDGAEDLPSNIIDFPRLCSEVGCGRAHHARGLCELHYAELEQDYVA